MTFGNVGGDNLEEQAKDMDEILRQRIDGKTVDEAMKYVKKKDIEDELPEKEFKDHIYKVVVVSGYRGDIAVQIWYK